MIRLLAVFLFWTAWVSVGHAQESFRVELGRDGETIGDMRPVFLPFESRPLPAISPTEVARRYRRLFEVSGEPEVRIDALNRLNNIRDRSGLDIGLSVAEEERVYREVIGSYESILAKGSYSGRLDELLYQMARAHALTGQSEESIQRLKQLVGLYPQSGLVPEARFRIAEAAFSAGRFDQAEAGYHRLIGAEAGGTFEAKARYMLGWSQFKQGEAAWNRAAKTFLAVLDESLPTADSIIDVAEADIDTIDDTLRVLALMAARLEDADTLLAWLADSGSSHWHYLLFDRLADYHAVRGDFLASTEINKAFVRYAGNHPKTPEFMAQIVSVWARAGLPDRVREAKANFVSMFAGQQAYQDLAAPDRSRWQAFSRTLADYYYGLASDALTPGQRKVASQAAIDGFVAAAGYYEDLAGRVRENGDLLRFAGDARLQAEQYDRALVNYRLAAYGSENYEAAADAGWAAVVLIRESEAQERTAPDVPSGLSALTAESERMAAAFPDDPRLPGLMADLSSRWFSTGGLDKAAFFSKKAIANELASPEERYASWLVMARVRQQRGEFDRAEHAWQQTLALAEGGETGVTAAKELASLRQQLAVAVYRQGEQASSRGDVSAAVEHFRRVDTVSPGSEVAVRGQYDAANTLLKASRHLQAIDELTRFRNSYPDHSLAKGIGGKLIHAYLSSNQPLQAAEELLVQATAKQSPWPDRLHAADLFQQAGEIGERNRLYLDYFATKPKTENAEQHIQLQTMRYRLIKFYQTDHNTRDDANDWRALLVAQELSSPWHSEQTLAWAARASLILGAQAAAVFASVELGNPLEASLARKQKTLELARQRFLDAEALAGEVVRSESLFRRAELYRTLARDLMASSVPFELSDMEAMQYRMLLEEEAYPFEEKAIELHSKNHQRIAARGYDAWIGKSLGALGRLYPGRYERTLRWMSGTMGANDGA